MASPGGASSGSSHLQNSGSEEDLQQLMDLRKRKRMVSNRESARRSRIRKQKHLDDLMAHVTQLRSEKHQIVTSINITSQMFLDTEAENSVLRAQMAELGHRLQSLNEIIISLSLNSGLNEKDYNQGGHDQISDNNDFLNPWSLLYVNQPIMASADMFMY